MATYKITLNKSSGTGGTDALWYDTVQRSFFGDEDCTEKVTATDTPTRECYRFLGYYSATSNGVQYIDGMGNLTDALMSLSIASAKTFYAQWEQVSWKVTLNDNGGAGGGGALYCRIDGGGCFADSMCEGEPVSGVAKPSRDGYAFAGYYESKSSSATQYFDESGQATANLEALTLTAAKTVYAQWVAPYKITVSANSGAGGTAAFYFDSVSRRFYAGADLAEQITAIAPHSRECFANAGCYSANSTTSTLCVAADGTISVDWTPKKAVTIYAQWNQVSWKVTLDGRSGSGGTSAVYYRIDGGGYYADHLCANQAAGIVPPTRGGYVFMGYFSATSNGTEYIDRAGSLLQEFNALALTAARTIYAQWVAAYKITLNKSSGTGGTDAVWWSSVDSAFFADDVCTVPASSVAVPTRECYRFLGYYNSASGTAQYMDAGGNYTAALSSLSITSAKTFYAQWEQVSWKVTLNDNGGSGGGGAFYGDLAAAAFYADDQLTTPVAAVAVPSLLGFDFIGYFAKASGGSRYVDGNGAITAAEALTADITVYARWRTGEYVLSFDYGGAAGEVLQKSVKFGEAIGALPDAARDGAVFAGWAVNGNLVTDATVWDVSGDATAIAQWVMAFGGVQDYFRLGGRSLVPISSSGGDECRRVAVTHGGKYEDGVNEAGGVWRNPSVTYAVKADTVVSVRLGQAFAAEWRNGAMTRSGYMITAVEVRTEVGRFPTVTVSATANEGANAVNNFTENAGRFDVSIPVVARARAQNLLGAISGGGHLQRVTLLASCDPVVCEENMMPCASDIVNGRYELDAETVAPAAEAAPTAASGFAATGMPVSTMDGAYRSYAIKAIKEMV